MKKKELYWIFTNIVVLLLGNYLLNNCSLPFTGFESTILKYYESFKSKNFPHTNKTNWEDSLFLINTCYDLELIDYFGESEFKQGEIAITKRKDLYLFLKKAHELDNYRYIMLDLDIDEIESPYNDSIKTLIMEMRDICIPRSHNFSVFDSRLDSKTGWVDYTTIPDETGFVKYELACDGMVSLPLKMYNDLCKHNAFCKFGLLYFDNYTLCQKTIIPDFKIKFLISNSVNGEICRTQYEYHNLGADIIDGNNVADIENRIVVLGDFFSYDLHDTYVGKMPGAIINLNTFLNLAEGKHKIQWGIVLIITFMYILMLIWTIRSTVILKRITALFPILTNIKKNKAVGLILTFCSLVFIFYVFSFILYLLFDYNYNAWFPVIWFTVVPRLIKVYKSQL